jgi:hypothetical protein
MTAKKISILKIARPKAKPGPCGTSKIELALVKPIGVSKKFHLLDVATLSHGLHTACHRDSRCLSAAFDNLDDDSLSDVHKTPLPTKTIEKHPCPPPLVFGQFMYFSFTLLPWALITALQMLPDFCPLWICRWRI